MSRAALVEQLAQRLARFGARLPPAPVLAREAFDDPAKRAAAAAQGYALDLPVMWHGGGGLRPGARRQVVHLTPHKDVAALYGAVDGPFVVRDPLIDASDDVLRAVDELTPLLRQARKSKSTGVLTRLLDRGRLGAQEQIIVTDPSAVRRVDAAFDPARLRARDVLAGVAIGAPVGGLTLRELLRERAAS